MGGLSGEEHQQTVEQCELEQRRFVASRERYAEAGEKVPELVDELRRRKGTTPKNPEEDVLKKDELKRIEAELAALKPEGIRAHLDATRRVSEKDEPLASVVAPADWIVRARVIAAEYILRHRAQDLFPGQSDVCGYVAKILRKEKTHGPQGPVADKYVQRNAIQGDWWKANKP